ncbi:MAG: hypothetical protein EOO90_09850 [Pedobacter sp.]|nr:MAG: hypothetical protein EOO90_09850 [Pedobacter sp.]
MDFKFYVGIVAGILTAVSSLPQILKVIRDKESQNISPIMYFILLAGNGLWSYYGILLEEWPIIATNLFSFGLNSIMLYLNYRYSK